MGGSYDPHLSYALVLACLVAGCSSEAQPDDTESGSGGAGAATSTGGHGGGGGGGGDACALDHEEPTGDLAIIVTNERSTPVYYSGSGCISVWRVDFADHPGASDGELGCRSVPPDCLDGTMAELAPGESVTFTWNGLLAENVEVPAGCEDPIGIGLFSCDRGISPAVGATGELEVFMQGNCTDPFSENGWDSCDEDITLSATFTHGPGVSAELTVSPPS